MKGIDLLTRVFGNPLRFVVSIEEVSPNLSYQYQVYPTSPTVTPLRPFVPVPQSRVSPFLPQRYFLTESFFTQSRTAHSRRCISSCWTLSYDLGITPFLRKDTSSPLWSLVLTFGLVPLLPQGHLLSFSPSCDSPRCRVRPTYPINVYLNPCLTCSFLSPGLFIH